MNPSKDSNPPKEDNVTPKESEVPSEEVKIEKDQKPASAAESTPEAKTDATMMQDAEPGANAFLNDAKKTKELPTQNKTGEHNKNVSEGESNNPKADTCTEADATKEKAPQESVTVEREKPKTETPAEKSTASAPEDEAKNKTTVPESAKTKNSGDDKHSTPAKAENSGVEKTESKPTEKIAEEAKLSDEEKMQDKKRDTTASVEKLNHDVITADVQQPESSLPKDKTVAKTETEGLDKSTDDKLVKPTFEADSVTDQHQSEDKQAVVHLQDKQVPIPEGETPKQEASEDKGKADEMKTDEKPDSTSKDSAQPVDKGKEEHKVETPVLDRQPKVDEKASDPVKGKEARTDNSDNGKQKTSSDDKKTSSATGNADGQTVA